jgi:hypothetical protein
MADLNHDGNPDLVTTNPNADNVVIDFGDGVGGVSGQASYVDAYRGASPWPT